MFKQLVLWKYVSCYQFCCSSSYSPVLKKLSIIMFKYHNIIRTLTIAYGQTVFVTKACHYITYQITLSTHYTYLNILYQTT